MASTSDNPVLNTASEVNKQPDVALASCSSSPTPSTTCAVPLDNALESLIVKHSFPEELDRSYKHLKREEHEKRIKNVRKELDYIETTNWKYDPVEQLPGH